MRFIRWYRDGVAAWLRMKADRRRVVAYGWAEQQRVELVGEGIIDPGRVDAWLIKQNEFTLAIAGFQDALADTIGGRK